jgi:hypothetical protein
LTNWLAFCPVCSRQSRFPDVVPTARLQALSLRRYHEAISRLKLSSLRLLR